MANEAEIEKEFWAALRASPFVMLGLAGADEAHSQPMTAFFDDAYHGLDRANHGPLWFFTSKDNRLVQHLNEGRRAVAHFVSRQHDLFACVHGDLRVSNDPATIDRFWSPQVAAWFPGGRNDPGLTLLRLDTGRAEIWRAGIGSALGIFVKSIFGRDARSEAEKNVAEVQL